MQAENFILKGLGVGELLPGVAVEPNERKEPISVPMLRLSVGKAGEPTKPPPIGCAGIGPETMSEGLSGECAEGLGKDVCVFQPRLIVAGTGFDDGARPEAFGCQLRECRTV